MSDGRVFQVQIGRISYNTSLEDVKLPPSVKAIHWGDITFSIKEGFLVRRVARTPEGGVDLHCQFDQSNRCAVDGDFVNELLDRGLIGREHKVQEAFIWLLKNEPNSIEYIEDVFRYMLPFGVKLFWPLKRGHRNIDIREGAVSIVINFRDRPELLLNFLRSLKAQNTSRQIELVLVDNQSSEGSLREIRAFYKASLDQRFSVKEIHYDHPFNHSDQTNLGVQESSNRIVIVANNDIELLSPDLIDRFVAQVLGENVATVGARAIGLRGHLVSAGMEACINRELPGGVGIRESTDMCYSLLDHDVIGTPFSFCAIKKEVWNEIGGLDPVEFPTQYNDVDFSLRASRKGYRHIYLGSEEIYHEPGCTEMRDSRRFFQYHQMICRKFSELRNLNGENQNNRLLFIEDKPSVEIRITNRLMRILYRLRRLMWTR